MLNFNGCISHIEELQLYLPKGPLDSGPSLGLSSNNNKCDKKQKNMLCEEVGDHIMVI